VFFAAMDVRACCSCSSDTESCLSAMHSGHCCILIRCYCTSSHHVCFAYKHRLLSCGMYYVQMLGEVPCTALLHDLMLAIANHARCTHSSIINMCSLCFGLLCAQQVRKVSEEEAAHLTSTGQATGPNSHVNGHMTPGTLLPVHCHSYPYSTA
jgi:hypothetical protein